MPVPLLRRAIRRRHSAVDEERGGRVVARHIYAMQPGSGEDPKLQNTLKNASYQGGWAAN